VTVLADQLPRLQAEEELQRRQSQGSLNSDGWYNLVLRATGDEDRADRAAAAFLMNELRAGRTPE